MRVLVWTANILGWPVIHLTIGAIAVRIPSKHFADDFWLTAPNGWEHDGRLYRNLFEIRKWKKLLPDGAPWLGGFAKNKLANREPSYLAEFLVETRRAELAHWLMLCCLPIFFTWNPPWACWIMTLYALAANIPCILAQRYNRLVLSRVVRNRRNVLSCQ